MKYVEFKNYIFKRLRNEFGFKKEGKMHVYRTDEVKIIIDTQKSDYSNSAYIHVGINPKDILINWNIAEPMTTELSRINMPLSDDKVLFQLDYLTFDELDDVINNFFKNIFPHLLTINELKKFYFNQQQNLFDYVREFWYGN